MSAEIKKYPGLQARGNSAIDANSILQNAETGKPTIYRANCVCNEHNTEYATRVDSYFEGDRYDCVFAEYRGGIRGNANFIQSNMLPVDVDGGKMIDEFQAEFAGFRYELVTSKSHGKPKNGKPPCDRFHVVFPLDRMVTDIAEYTRLKDAFVRAYPYCDRGAKDVARFFYGNREAKKRKEGKGEPLCVDTILAEAKAADSVMPAAPQDYTRTARYKPPSVLYEGERNAGDCTLPRAPCTRNMTTRRKQEPPTMLSGASRNCRKASGTAYIRGRRRTTPSARQAASGSRPQAATARTRWEYPARQYRTAGNTPRFLNKRRAQ